MKRRYFRIAVAVFVNVLLVATAVAHACIGTGLVRAAHEHSALKAAALVQHSHATGQDENCRSVRDRLLSLAPRSTETHTFAGHFQIIPVIGEQTTPAIQMVTAERPPGSSCFAGYQPPLYIANLVFRI